MRSLVVTALLALVLTGLAYAGCTGSAHCTGDEQCQNGALCDGRERCDPSHPRADEDGCVARASACPACTEGAFFEEDFAAYCAGELPGFPDVDCSDPVTFDAACLASEAACSHDRDCDDGVFCNGAEVCDRFHLDADERGCVATGPRCGGNQECDEAGDRCVTDCSVEEDGDGDGALALACGGQDCDDADANRAPGLEEVCDVAGRDEDCDLGTVGARDEDGDGHVDEACFNSDGDTLTRGGDCDDEAGAVHPGQHELCNGVDDDCDGDVDEGLQVMVYDDEDGDGFGVLGSGRLGCLGEPGLVPRSGDCDDDNAQIVPGALRCGEGGDGSGYELCGEDGSWSSGACETGTCHPQPAGHGVCL